ncbi:unnamed protein product [Cylindrotheca closterium]|uniref:Uncharacterized protein n=1 Tax=Cylindrotheca closterium TaxID=2856 RepID=A0AAD2FEA5_9STRA|nr:unnamed protein product [Cylindrotheca closterium]
MAESGSNGWVPEFITIAASGDYLVPALLAGTLHVVSDGSYKAKVGTACAQILTEDCKDIIWITCQTPGKSEEQSSTHTELIGLMASLLVLEWMSQVAQLKLFASQCRSRWPAMVLLPLISPSPKPICPRLAPSLTWPTPSGPCFATFPSKFTGAMLKVTWTSTDLSPDLSPNWTGGSSAMLKLNLKHNPTAACWSLQAARLPPTPASSMNLCLYSSTVLSLPNWIRLTSWSWSLFLPFEHIGPPRTASPSSPSVQTPSGLPNQWAPRLQSPPCIRIACDGFSALLNTFSDNRVTPQQAQFDLVSSIREALARSRASWEPNQVYGHLDKATSFSCLSWWSKQNVEVDAWAVAYCHQLEASHRLIAPNARFFTKLAALYIGDVRQSRLNPEQVQELVALPALRKRWHERQMISPETELETDWTSLAHAMRSLPAGVQRWTTKHVVGMCGVGKFKVRWGAADSAACPCCGEFEDHLHVPRCTAPSVSAE